MPYLSNGHARNGDLVKYFIYYTMSGPYLNDIGHNANNGNQNFPLSFKYGYFGHSNFPLLFKYDNFDNIKSTLSTHFLRCHLKMRHKFLLLFKYEFFETLILSQSQKKVIILQLLLEFEFAVQFVFETL